jgi:poly(hydroxyalkanoate) depolymerase family esterase
MTRRNPLSTTKQKQLDRLKRFRDRLRGLITRVKPPQPTPPAPETRAPPIETQLHALPTDERGADALPAESSVPVAPDATPSPALQPASPLISAQTFEGSARSENGATSPWLLLPPERNFRLYVPAHARDLQALPLVVMIHGCKETADEFAQGTRMNAIADREGFAVLYPDQASFANMRRCWNWFEPNTAAGFGECAIILEMIREAFKRTSIDSQRVYVAGMSSGAALAGLLGYHHPDVFAAVAVHSGLPPMNPPSAGAALSAMEKGVRVDAEMLADAYWNTHAVLPPTLLVVHGDADSRVTEKNATSMTKLWEKLFESAPQAHPLVREDKDVPSTETARSYAQIDWLNAGRIVIRGVRIHGLAHAWSGGDPAFAYNDAKGPDASAMIWRFFERQSR